VTLAPGTRLGPTRSLGPIGAGRMAEVYKAPQGCAVAGDYCWGSGAVAFAGGSTTVEKKPIIISSQV
jgi:hypothetical protein